MPKFTNFQLFDNFSLVQDNNFVINLLMPLLRFGYYCLTVSHRFFSLELSL